MAAHAHNDANDNGHTSLPGVETIKHPTLFTFAWTYVALLVLLVITYVLYRIDLNAATGLIWLNIGAALTVAVIKAALVVMNFMNVKGGTKLIWVWAALGFIWLFLMGGIFMDYRMRPPTPGWQANASR